MTQERDTATSRRQVLRLGGAAGGLLAAGPLLAAGSAEAASKAHGAAVSPAAGLPVKLIERIVGAQGTVSSGVLQIEIDRDDIPGVHKEGVPIKPSFEINGTFCFQALHDGSVVMNGDFAFKPEEMNPAIDQMLRHGLVWQAQHQHLFGLQPMVWFMHMRGRGSARQLAEAVHAVLKVTSVPLPQAPPKNPKTPLDVHRLAAIIGGAATVGAAGVVTVDVTRRDRVRLGGVEISPELNIFTPVSFQPMGGDHAVVVPDFGMTAQEIQPVTRVMRAQGWEANCLYNQETDEFPQLYFSHQFKVGNAYQLAREVRRGLDHMNMAFT
jgi:hypothetical protein